MPRAMYGLQLPTARSWKVTLRGAGFAVARTTAWHRGASLFKTHFPPGDRHGKLWDSRKGTGPARRVRQPHGNEVAASRPLESR